MAETFVIAQGGGPTAVINQTMVGATLEVRRRYPKARVLGSRHGVRGVRDGDFVVLSDLPEEQLRLIAGTPSAALGSTRDKPDAAYCDLVLKGLKKAGARRLHLYRRQRHVGHAADPDRRLRRLDGLRACAEDHRQRSDGERPHAGLHLGGRIRRRRLPVGRPRFPRAARRLCRRSSWAAMPASSPPRRPPGGIDGDSGPHLIYVPERAFSVPRFIDDVQAHARQAQALHRRRLRRRLDRGRALAGRDRSSAPTRSSATRMATSSFRAATSTAPSNRRWRKNCPASAPASMRSATCRAAMHRRDQQGRPAGSLRRRRPCRRGGGAGRRLGGAAVRRAEDGAEDRAAEERRRQDQAHARRLSRRRAAPACPTRAWPIMERLVPENTRSASRSSEAQAGARASLR